MNNLYDRLIEVCVDQGLNPPRGTDIQDIVGISSGRVSQLRDAGPQGNINAASLARLVSLGYQPDWILYGKGPKFIADDSIPAQPRQLSLSDDQQLTKLEKQLIEHLRQLESKEQRAFTLKIIAAANLRKALHELEQEDKGVANG